MGNTNLKVTLSAAIAPNAVSPVRVSSTTGFRAPSGGKVLGSSLANSLAGDIDELAIAINNLFALLKKPLPASLTVTGNDGVLQFSNVEITDGTIGDTAISDSTVADSAITGGTIADTDITDSNLTSIGGAPPNTLTLQIQDGVLTVVGAGTAAGTGVVDVDGNVKAATYGAASVTDTELGYLVGVTSDLQTQINTLQAAITALTAAKANHGTYAVVAGNVTI